MKVPAAAIALCGFVIAATACAPTADQAPAADEAAAPQADVQSLEATINAHWEAFNAGDRQTTADQHLPRFTLFSMDDGPLWVLESEED